MRITNERNSATMETINLKVSMCRDTIANSNITKVFVVNPCDSSNTDVDTPLNVIHDMSHSSTVYNRHCYGLQVNKNLGNLKCI